MHEQGEGGRKVREREGSKMGKGKEKEEMEKKKKKKKKGKGREIRRESRRRPRSVEHARRSGVMRGTRTNRETEQR